MRKLKSLTTKIFRFSINITSLGTFVSILTLSCSTFSEEKHKTERCDSMFQYYNDSIYVNLCNNTQAIFDYNESKNRARYSKKNILIFFNSLACVNCRKFEDNIIFNNQIVDKINNEFVFASLFVDEKKEIRIFDTLGLNFTKHEIIYTGQLHNELQLRLTNYASNPTFVITDENGVYISRYDGDYSMDLFLNWLNSHSR